jgi:hypothetical protein
MNGLSSGLRHATNVSVAVGRAARRMFENAATGSSKNMKTKRPKKKDAEGDTGRILLRVFFHVHGDKIILLLGGYDKAARSSHSYQQSQIELSRRRLASWRSREGG